VVQCYCIGFGAWTKLILVEVQAVPVEFLTADRVQAVFVGIKNKNPY
jgi:hypothetical protein